MRLAWLSVALGLWGCAHGASDRAPQDAPGQRPPPAPIQAQPNKPPPDPLVIEARAHASFDALEPGFEVQLALKLDDPKKLKAFLSVKAQGLARLEREYQAIIQLGSPVWTVASYVRLGMLYDDIAQALRTAPLPDELTSEQIEHVRSEMDKHAAPLDEKAAAAYRRAVSLEREDPPSEWVRYARQRLLREAEPPEAP